MKGSTALAHWKNAVEGLESAEILLNHGKYKRSVAEAYYAMETAARASLAEKNVNWAHSRFPGHALTPTGVMAIRCKQFHLPDL